MGEARDSAMQTDFADRHHPTGGPTRPSADTREPPEHDHTANGRLSPSNDPFDHRPGYTTSPHAKDTLSHQNLNSSSAAAAAATARRDADDDDDWPPPSAANDDANPNANNVAPPTCDDRPDPRNSGRPSSEKHDRFYPDSTSRDDDPLGAPRNGRGAPSDRPNDHRYHDRGERTPAGRDGRPSRANTGRDRDRDRRDRRDETRSLHCRGYDIPTTDENKLRRVFEPFGKVVDVYLPKDYYTDQYRGFAYIQFDNERDADRAREQLDRTEILNDGRVCAVMWASGRRKTPGDMRRIDIERDNPHVRGRFPAAVGGAQSTDGRRPQGSPRRGSVRDTDRKDDRFVGGDGDRPAPRSPDRRVGGYRGSRHSDVSPPGRGGGRRDRDFDRDLDRDISDRSRDKYRGSDYDRDMDNGRDRGRGFDRDRERFRESDRGRSRDRDLDRDYDRDRFRDDYRTPQAEKERESDRLRERERKNDRDTVIDASRGRDRDRDYEKDREFSYREDDGNDYGRHPRRNSRDFEDGADRSGLSTSHRAGSPTSGLRSSKRSLRDDSRDVSHSPPRARRRYDAMGEAEPMESKGDAGYGAGGQHASIRNADPRDDRRDFHTSGPGGSNSAVPAFRSAPAPKLRSAAATSPTGSTPPMMR